LRRVILNKKKPLVGLALGAGGARGLAHLGVIEILEKENIPIDIITGTSMGSLIGGIYACGTPVKYIIQLSRELNWDNVTDITFPRKGLIKGDKLLSFLEIITQNKDFEDLQIPFAAIACDIEKGEHIVLNTGSVAKAIRASTSIPGIYVPFQHQDRYLVDGGVLDRVPISTLRMMGADIIIAVDIGVKAVNNNVKNLFDILLNTFDIMQQEFEKIKEHDADIIIKPDLENITKFELDKADLCVKAGRDVAKQMLDKIKNTLSRRGLYV